VPGRHFVCRVQDHWYVVRFGSDGHSRVEVGAIGASDCDGRFAFSVNARVHSHFYADDQLSMIIPFHEALSCGDFVEQSAAGVLRM
jgi:hypothetical protein